MKGSKADQVPKTCRSNESKTSANERKGIAYQESNQLVVQKITLTKLRSDGKNRLAERKQTKKGSEIPDLTKRKRNQRRKPQVLQHKSILEIFLYQ